jgi:hypothetical protein
MERRENVPGSVYLLHLHPAYQHAKHYLGWTEGEPIERFRVHLAGNGSPLIRAQVASGGTIILARVWTDVTRNFERKLKDRHYSPKLCPICTLHPHRTRSL